MSDTDLFGVRGGKKPVSKFGAFVKNASLFLGALLITVTLGSFLKAYAGGGATKGQGAFYLQATSAMKPGDVISTETAVWRSALGKRSGEWVTDSSKKSETYWGWRVVSPIRAGQPVLKQSVIAVNTGATAFELPPGKVGFVLMGDELAAATEMLQEGSWVNIIAVVGGGSRSKAEADSPSVTTVVEGSKVLHVRAGLKRGGRGLDPSVTIAVSPEEAEDLAAWRQAGALVVVLASATSPRSIHQGDLRQLWDTEAVPEEDSASAQSSTYGVARAAPAPTRSVSVVTPSGVQKQDLK
ncbi:RcpC/CpaB family pilus assembly protein [Phenylobacterium sp.]|uniref:RcpC/CpaB family pilus assembly protein n=1 Tax=Phenylobacterium sp. TaxID=1871053 RepID=UPI0027262E28|nr:RcpC/CpaB family pilus assembly protein [Phenylobacterium sp.]MDO8379271.1 RcpC/CpaB family pilus assembly protein [Phenylobacterium sp.]